MNNSDGELSDLFGEPHYSGNKINSKARHGGVCSASTCTRWIVLAVVVLALANAAALAVIANKIMSATSHLHKQTESVTLAVADLYQWSGRVPDAKFASFAKEAEAGADGGRTPVCSEAPPNTCVSLPYSFGRMVGGDGRLLSHFGVSPWFATKSSRGVIFDNRAMSDTYCFPCGSRAVLSLWGAKSAYVPRVETQQFGSVAAFELALVHGGESSVLQQLALWAPTPSIARSLTQFSFNFDAYDQVLDDLHGFLANGRRIRSIVVVRRVFVAYVVSTQHSTGWLTLLNDTLVRAMETELGVIDFRYDRRPSAYASFLEAYGTRMVSTSIEGAMRDDVHVCFVDGACLMLHVCIGGDARLRCDDDKEFDAWSKSIFDDLTLARTLAFGTDTICDLLYKDLYISGGTAQPYAQLHARRSMQRAVDAAQSQAEKAWREAFEREAVWCVNGVHDDGTDTCHCQANYAGAHCTVDRSTLSKLPVSVGEGVDALGVLHSTRNREANMSAVRQFDVEFGDALAYSDSNEAYTLPVARLFAFARVATLRRLPRRSQETYASLAAYALSLIDAKVDDVAGAELLSAARPMLNKEAVTAVRANHEQMKLVERLFREGADAGAKEIVRVDVVRDVYPIYVLVLDLQEGKPYCSPSAPVLATMRQLLEPIDYNVTQEGGLDRYEAFFNAVGYGLVVGEVRGAMRETVRVETKGGGVTDYTLCIGGEVDACASESGWLASVFGDFESTETIAHMSLSLPALVSTECRAQTDSAEFGPVAVESMRAADAALREAQAEKWRETFMRCQCRLGQCETTFFLCVPKVVPTCTISNEIHVDGLHLVIGYQLSDSVRMGGDYNGDNCTDALIVTWPAEVAQPKFLVLRVALSTCDGNFAIINGDPGLPAPWSDGYLRIYVFPNADFDGDGRSDLFTHDSGGSAVVRFSNGDGTFRVGPEGLQLPHGAQCQKWNALADFTGDGRADIFTVDMDGTAVIMINNMGDGTFTQGNPFAVSSTGNSGIALAHAVGGDYNGDGKEDIIRLFDYTGADNQGAVMFSYGNGSFWYGPNLTLTGGGTEGIHRYNSFGRDYNGDGLADILSVIMDAGESGTIQVKFSLGNGKFDLGPPVAFPMLGGGTLRNVALPGGFYNRDRLEDIVVRVNRMTGLSVVMYSAGDGTFVRGPQMTLAPDSPYGDDRTKMSTGNIGGGVDFNGDGVSDTFSAPHVAPSVSWVVLSVCPAP